MHVLVIPKMHIATLADVGPEHDALLGRMLGLAPRLMRELGVDNGFRTVINTGRDGGQEVSAPAHARDGRAAALAKGVNCRGVTRAPHPSPRIESSLSGERSWVRSASGIG